MAGLLLAVLGLLLAGLDPAGALLLGGALAVGATRRGAAVFGDRRGSGHGLGAGALLDPTFLAVVVLAARADSWVLDAVVPPPPTGRPTVVRDVA